MTGTRGKTERTVVHLVPHTHWDREWYEPFQTFRMRLVELIDELLERMAEDPRLRFTLDGQAATVDDYLEIRPGAEPLIRRLIGEGRLAIGPWQILMDEFLVSGETIIRNLEFGWARAEELGGAMPVGYLPDMFGHIAQMPQILRRAGIDRAVVWRGVPMAIDCNSFVWRALDGSEVEAEYLVGGYGNGAYLFDVPELLADKLVGYRAANAPFYGDRSLLAMYGTDHAVPSPLLADLVEEVNRAGGDIVVRLETLADYTARDDGVRGELAGDPTPPVWTGELRSGARANMLMGVTSARVDLKAAAARAERLLERYAEPLAALHGGNWPARFLELAWRRVVDNSAHDSICGCSHDEVVSQVITRFAEAEQIARGIIRSTLGQIAARVPPTRWAVANPSPTAREDLVELDIAIPPEWDPVAVRVGNRLLPTQELGRPNPVLGGILRHGREIPELLARRRHGRELFGRLINGAAIEAGSPDSQPRLTILVDDVPDPVELDVDELLERIEAATSAEADALWSVILRGADRRLLGVRIPVGALGWTEIEVVGLSNGAGGGEANPSARGGARPEPIDHPVMVGKRSLSNGLVAVEVGNDGTFSLGGGGSELRGVGRIVDGGDAGDSYNHAPPAVDGIVERPSSVSVAVTADGPLLGILQIVRTYDWPIGLTDDGATRSDRAASTEVTTELELRAGDPFVLVRLTFDNASRDHRVRWHIPLPRSVAGSAAEGQFAVVERGLEMEGGHGEVPLPTYPARGFVDVDGLTVLLDQITEYEVVDGSELALTILRSFGLISRNTNAFREDPAGPQIPVPNAQLRGERTFAFALAPHRGRWERAGATALQERYQHPFLVTRGTATETDVPGESDELGPGVPGFELSGDGVVLSALRRRGAWLEARVVLEGSQDVEAVIRGHFSTARRVDLLGRPGEELPVEAPGLLRLMLAPWEIATLQLRDGPG
jgi:mannosylglycerate hydrolase